MSDQGDQSSAPAEDPTPPDDETTASHAVQQMQMLTPGDVADVLRFSRAHIYWWIRNGALRCVRVGRRPRITQEELRRFIAEGPAKPLDTGIVSEDA